MMWGDSEETHEELTEKMRKKTKQVNKQNPHLPASLYFNICSKFSSCVGRFVQCLSRVLTWGAILLIKGPRHPGSRIGRAQGTGGSLVSERNPLESGGPWLTLF